MDLWSDNSFYKALGVLFSIVFVLFCYFKWIFNHWKREGVPFLQPKIPFGNASKLFCGKYSMAELFTEFYRNLKAKGYNHGGVYFTVVPLYLPVNLNLIKHILQIDFQHFVNHGFYVNEEIDPLNSHLFNLEDSKWRNLRAKLTPTFTSGKMKMMFPTLVDCAFQLREIVDDAAKSGVALEFKDILARFGTDVIGSCAFGIECNSLKNPDAIFRKYGKRIVENTPIEIIKPILGGLLPRSLLSFFKFKFTKPDVEEFFMNVVKENVQFREANNIYRKDFMHLLIQLKNLGKVEDSNKIKENNNKKNSGIGLTIEEITAQAYIFFMAGFESSATTMTCALFELATNQKIQENLRSEIKTVMDENEGKITYEAIKAMTYLDKVIFETLRKYPPLSILTRVCNKDYFIPSSTICLKKGTKVVIPIMGIQKDPEYYPDPEKFDPNRFSEENKMKRPGFTWLPFGEGPRNCIGTRFGMLQIKIGLTILIKDYNFSLEHQIKPLEIDKTSFILAFKGGMWFNVNKI